MCSREYTSTRYFKTNQLGILTKLKIRFFTVMSDISRFSCSDENDGLAVFQIKKGEFPKRKLISKSTVSLISIIHFATTFETQGNNKEMIMVPDLASSTKTIS